MQSSTSTQANLASYTGNIGIVALPLDGRGDVAGADKIASVVAEIMSKAQLTFSIFDPVVPQMTATFEKEMVPRSELVKSIQRAVLREKEFLQKIGRSVASSFIPPIKTAVCLKSSA